jgi:hypothetical protein
MDRDAKDKESNIEEKDENEATSVPQASKSGKSTPLPDTDPSNQTENELKSPATESTGVRTPTGRRVARNPWTLFMKMTISASEGELKEFFGEAQSGVSLWEDDSCAVPLIIICPDHSYQLSDVE